MMKMVAGGFYIPKRSTFKPLGEDAYFISHVGQTIGVADGVGGWARKGIDAGTFARELMANAEYEVDNQSLMSGGGVDPMKVLKLAFLNTEAKGSSTACILTLSGNCLHAANIGDSGFLIIRNGTSIYHSPVQQFEFNCPYQLAKSGDGPSLAMEVTVEVEPGDIVILGTDGLFDNVFDTEIEDIVKACLENNNFPELMAWNIAELALDKSMEESSVTPFTKAAMTAGKVHHGGKYDDITVVAAYIGFPDLEYLYGLS